MSPDLSILGRLRALGLSAFQEQLFLGLVFWGPDERLTGQDVATWPAEDACTTDCQECCGKICSGLLPEPIEVPTISRLSAFGPAILLDGANYCVALRTEGIFGFNHGLWKPLTGNDYTFDWLAVENPIQSETLSVVGPHANSTQLPVSAFELARFFVPDAVADDIQFAADAIGLDLTLMVTNPEVVMRSPLPAFKVRATVTTTALGDITAEVLAGLQQCSAATRFCPVLAVGLTRAASTQGTLVTALEALGGPLFTSLKDVLTSTDFGLLLSLYNVDTSLVASLYQPRFVVNTVDLGGLMKFDNPINRVDITKGVHVAARIQKANLPATCDDWLCDALSTVLVADGTALFLLGSISTNAFRLEAQMADLPLGDDFTIKSAGVFVCFGTDCSLVYKPKAGSGPSPPPTTSGTLLGVKGMVFIDTDQQNPDGSTYELGLQGSVSFATSNNGVSGSVHFSSSGYWFEAFGLEYLHVGNLLLGATFVPEPPFISGFSIGGSIILGKTTAAEVGTCAKCIIVDGYFSASASNPRANYIFARITGSLTLSGILAALDITDSLPDWLGDTGLTPLPNEEAVVLSHAKLAAELKFFNPPILIPQGTRVAGVLNVFGWALSVDVNINLPSRFYADISCDPLDFWGLFTVAHSRDQQDMGPEFYINIVLLPLASAKFEVKIHGYIKVILSYEAEVDIVVGPQGFSFAITRTFFSTWDLNLLVAGNTQGDFIISASMGSEDGLLRDLVAAGAAALDSLGGSIRSASDNINQAATIVGESEPLDLSRLRTRAADFADTITQKLEVADCGDIVILSDICEGLRDVSVDVLQGLADLVDSALAGIESLWNNYLRDVVANFLEDVATFGSWLADGVDFAANWLTELASGKFLFDIISAFFQAQLEGFDINTGSISLGLEVKWGTNVRILNITVYFDDLERTMADAFKEFIFFSFDTVGQSALQLVGLDQLASDISSQLVDVPVCLVNEHCADPAKPVCQNNPLFTNPWLCMPKLPDLAVCAKDSACESTDCETVRTGVRNCKPAGGFPLGWTCNEDVDCQAAAYCECTVGCEEGGVCRARLPDMSACTDDDMCLSGLCNYVTASERLCRPTAGWPLGAQCFSQQCVDGAYCNCGASCGVSSGVCRTQSEDNAVCDVDAQCTSGVCELTTGTTSYCKPTGGFADGHSCISHTNCQTGSYCTGNALSSGFCQPKLDDLQPCATDGDCLSSICQLTSVDTRYCRPAQGFPLNFECNSDDDCIPSQDYCDCTNCAVSSGFCAHKVDDLTDCSDDDACKSGDCETTGLVGDRQCKPSGGFPDNHQCNEDVDCLAVSFCDCSACDVTPGTCKPKLADNAACSSGDDDECLSGACVFTSVTESFCMPAGGFANGHQCNEDTECRTGSYCDCTDCLVSSGVCAPKLADLADCSDNDACLSGDCETTGLVGDRQCKPSTGFPNGHQCNEDVDCTAASFCDCSACGVDPGTCTPKLADNTACTSGDDDECLSGACVFTSVTESFCMPAGGFADGHQCNADTECQASSYCDCTDCLVSSGVCAPKLADLADCNDNDACLSGNCETTGLVGDRQCKPSTGFPNGHQCNEDVDCTAATFCDCSSCTVSPGTCTAKQADGTDCGGDNECLSNDCETTGLVGDRQCKPSGGFPDNHQCNDDADCLAVSFCDCSTCDVTPGTCKPKLADNAACSSGDDDECLSGACVFTSVTESFCMPAGGFADGHQCNADTECQASSYCDCTDCLVSSGVCAPKLADLADCNDNDACLSGDCETTGLVGDRQCKPSTGFPNGHQCNEDVDCASTLFCDCTSCSTSPGTCTPKLQDLAVCEGDNECLSGDCETTGLVGDRQCKPAGGFGVNHQCNEDVDCQSDLYCDCDACTVVPGTCQPILADLADCDDDNACSSGVCETTGLVGDRQCKPSGGFPDNHQCNEDVDCLAVSFCDCSACDVTPGTCKPKLADNAACSSGDDDECLSGACVFTSVTESFCMPAGGFANGHQCNEDTECRTGSYCDCTDCLVSSGVCAPKLADLADCSDNDACLSGDCETTGLVGDRQCKPSTGFPNGHQCNEDVDCASTLFCDCTSCSTSPGTCQPKLPDNALCSAGDDDECLSGVCEFTSVSDSYCMPAGGFGNGHECNEDTECRSTSYCDCTDCTVSSGVCTFKLDNLQNCNDNDACLSGDCETTGLVGDRQCKPSAGFPDGHQCNENADCISASFCDCTACGTSPGTCTTKLDDLLDCNDDAACKSSNCETTGLTGDRQCRPLDGFPLHHQWFVGWLVGWLVG